MFGAQKSWIDNLQILWDILKGIKTALDAVYNASTQVGDWFFDTGVGGWLNPYSGGGAYAAGPLALENYGGGPVAPATQAYYEGGGDSEFTPHMFRESSGTEDAPLHVIVEGGMSMVLAEATVV